MEFLPGREVQVIPDLIYDIGYNPIQSRRYL